MTLKDDKVMPRTLEYPQALPQVLRSWLAAVVVTIVYTLRCADGLIRALLCVSSLGYATAAVDHQRLDNQHNKLDRTSCHFAMMW